MLTTPSHTAEVSDEEWQTARLKPKKARHFSYSKDAWGEAIKKLVILFRDRHVVIEAYFDR